MTEPIICDKCNVEMVEVKSPSNRTNLITETSTTSSPSVTISRLSGSRKIEKIVSMICPKCQEKKQAIRWSQ